MPRESNVKLSLCQAKRNFIDRPGFLFNSQSQLYGISAYRHCALGGIHSPNLPKEKAPTIIARAFQIKNQPKHMNLL
jgi:hypothetical protein